MTSTHEAETRTHAPGAARARRRLRLVLPLGLLATAVLVVAIVVASRYSQNMKTPSMIQSAGFYAPTDPEPVQFSLPVLQPASSSSSALGSKVAMSSFTGKPLVLNMWASNCTVCKSETPAIESIARRVGHAVDFVGVDTLDVKTLALAFLHRYDVTYLQLFDPGERVGSGYGIPGLPVTVFVSALGKVRGEYLGALNQKTLTHYLRTLFGVRA